MSIFTSVIY